MRNVISEMLTKGVYPVKLSLTRQQAFEVIRDFQTSWDSLTPSGVPIVADGWCYAHYMTRKGKQKKCLIMWNVF